MKVKYISVLPGQKAVTAGDIREMDESLFDTLFGAKSAKDSSPKDPRKIKLSDDQLAELEGGAEISVEEIGFIDPRKQKQFGAELKKVKDEKAALLSETEQLKAKIKELENAQKARAEQTKEPEAEEPKEKAPAKKSSAAEQVKKAAAAQTARTSDGKFKPKK